MLVLAGCGISAGNRIAALSQTQLQYVETGALCSPWADSPNVAAERRRRGLSDCSLPDMQCVNAGYRAGSQAYNDCRYGPPLTPEQAAYRACLFSMMGQPTRTGTIGEAMSNAQLVCSGRATQAPSLPIPPAVGAGTVCFASGEEVSGMNKMCYYNCLGSRTAVNVSVTDLCQLTIQR
jgi:hypothetical protein